ncbi:hypothetical protein OAL09_08955 [Verrucomicrobia bacterium]|nr:hypothetical protein [Verrucomicrobiales bacterium]MDC0049455.1 hypothetical protein [Verrucomicrobiota bacterium]NCG28257.1 hypothetical protein [Verrucomicrobiales bacterium]|tara:strand:+ start:124 stop:942 length:819 start_codon:yes stop_codon:yes gene_type:complete
MFETLLVIGTLFLAYGCRSFEFVAVRKFGAFCVITATFLTGYFLSGHNVICGIVTALGWFFLPGIEIMTRIRRMRLPLDNKMQSRFPPNRDLFPQLREFTNEVEVAGFEHIQDSGWEWGGVDRFVRFFYDPNSKAQATINLNSQSHLAFNYMSVSSRTRDGKILMTWNYPFSEAMKLTPDCIVNYVRGIGSFDELIEVHRKFLDSKGIINSNLQETDPDELGKLTEKEMRNQVDHNLDRGLLKLSGSGTFCYSWKGLFFLWYQSIKDMIRLS